MYKSASTKIIAMSGSVLWASIHFRNTSTDAVHLPRLNSGVHWCRYCIVYRHRPQCGHMLVVACPYWCNIVILDNVLRIHFMMKWDMWRVVLSCACLNDAISITPQSSMLVRFLSSQYLSRRISDISYNIDWAMLEWTGTLQMYKIGSP